MIKSVSTCFLLMIGLIASAQESLPWDRDELFKAPQWQVTETAEKKPYQSILYQSVPFKGKPVEVFAYYAAPKGKAPEGGWPAVVCVHGGGGTAFDAWVKQWNAHGYAAISMDLEGHVPLKEDPDNRKSPRLPTPHPGPSRHGVFHDFKKPIDEQWYTHAVAQVILAHSLIRSFPEVNPDKTGITGISWGGTLTSTVMGLDPRFKFAIPVYGCGFLPESEGHQGRAIKPGQHSDVVNQYFDGSAYFGNVTYPTFWVNGTNDMHFAMPATQQSLEAVNGPTTLRFGLNMPHGHNAGWRPKEIYAFADSIVQGGDPLPSIGPLQIDQGSASATVESPHGIKKAQLIYTQDTSAWPERQWQTSPRPVAVTGSTLTAAIPSGATAVYLSVIDERGLMVTSKYSEIGGGGLDAPADEVAPLRGI